MAWRRMTAFMFAMTAFLPAFFGLGVGGGGAAAVVAGELVSATAEAANLMEAGETLRAGIFLSPPFVMADGTPDVAAGDVPVGATRYVGMAVELWEEAVKSLGIHSKYVLYESWGDLLEAVGGGEVDVAVGAVTVSHNRAEVMHFSFPWYDGGMRILKKSSSKSFLGELAKSQRFRVYGVLCLVFVGLGLFLTWFRKRRDSEFPKDFKTGFTLTLLDMASSMRSGETDQEYLGWKGNLLSAAWMMFGLGLVAYITSTMTTAMTTVQLDKDGIYELGDLPGKKVGGLRGGMSMKYLRELHLDVVGFRDMEDAVDKLLQNQIRAVVSDAPVLEHWVNTHPDQDLEVVGQLFHPDKYAFAANPRHARIMDKITLELIRLNEAGYIEKLKRKYLGEGHGYLYQVFME